MSRDLLAHGQTRFRDLVRACRLWRCVWRLVAAGIPESLTVASLSVQKPVPEQQSASASPVQTTPAAAVTACGPISSRQGPGRSDSERDIEPLGPRPSIRSPCRTGDCRQHAGKGPIPLRRSCHCGSDDRVIVRAYNSRFRRALSKRSGAEGAEASVVGGTDGIARGGDARDALLDRARRLRRQSQNSPVVARARRPWSWSNWVS